jgi:Pyridoxal phosphate biosynthetic protein PdxA
MTLPARSNRAVDESKAQFSPKSGPPRTIGGAPARAAMGLCIRPGAGEWRRRGGFDAVPAMYHDQDRIAMKLMGFDRGITLLGGFPFATSERLPVAPAVVGNRRRQEPRPS